MSVDATVARVAQLEAMLGLSPRGCAAEHDLCDERSEYRRDRARTASPPGWRP